MLLLESLQIQTLSLMWELHSVTHLAAFALVQPKGEWSLCKFSFIIPSCFPESEILTVIRSVLNMMNNSQCTISYSLKRKLTKVTAKTLNFPLLVSTKKKQQSKTLIPLMNVNSKKLYPSRKTLTLCKYATAKHAVPSSRNAIHAQNMIALIIPWKCSFVYSRNPVW